MFQFIEIWGNRFMKIAMIGHKRIPSREGGVEIVVEELASRMAASGHEVTVYNRGGHHVAGKENDIMSKIKTYKGIHLVTVPTSGKKSLNAVVYAIFATIRAVCSHFDVIHYHAEGSCAFIWLPHLLGIRTVATIHGLDWQRSKWGGFATKFLLFGEKMAAKYADEIIVLSHNVQQYFLDTYHRKTRFVPNGITIPEPKVADMISKQYGLEPNNYILFLARIVPEKGLHYLMEAYRNLDTDMPLVIAGGNSHSEGYMSQMQQMAAEDQRIIMTGFVQGQLLEELYSNCYLYVLPSDVEGMPISLLEAISYGRMCLCSDIPENKETAREQAGYFQHSNTEDLRQVLKSVLQQSEKTQEWHGNDEMHCRCRREYVASRYNWEKVVEQTIALYC